MVGNSDAHAMSSSNQPPYQRQDPLGAGDPGSPLRATAGPRSSNAWAWAAAVIIVILIGAYALFGGGANRNSGTTAGPGTAAQHNVEARPSTTGPDTPATS